jgi:hypothetical protein
MVIKTSGLSGIAMGMVVIQKDLKIGHFQDCGWLSIIRSSVSGGGPRGLQGSSYERVVAGGVAHASSNAVTPDLNFGNSGW